MNVEWKKEYDSNHMFNELADFIKTNRRLPQISTDHETTIYFYYCYLYVHADEKQHIELDALNRYTDETQIEKQLRSERWLKYQINHFHELLDEQKNHMKKTQMWKNYNGKFANFYKWYDEYLTIIVTTNPVVIAKFIQSTDPDLYQFQSVRCYIKELIERVEMF